MTRPRATPQRISVPMNTMHERCAIDERAAAEGTAAIDLATGSLSPVKLDSSTYTSRAYTLNTRTSAFTCTSTLHPLNCYYYVPASASRIEL